MNDPAAEQRGIYRNIHNRPKGRGINPLSASVGSNVQKSPLLSGHFSKPAMPTLYTPFLSPFSGRLMKKVVYLKGTGYGAGTFLQHHFIQQ